MKLENPIVYCRRETPPIQGCIRIPVQEVHLPYWKDAAEGVMEKISLK